MVFELPDKYLSFSRARKHNVNIFGAETFESDWMWFSPAYKIKVYTFYVPGKYIFPDTLKTRTGP